MKEKQNSLQALVFDTLYEQHLGVIVYVRIFQGSLKKEQKITLLKKNFNYKIEAVGVDTPEKTYTKELTTGEIGWFGANIRDIKAIKAGDVILEEGEKKEPPIFLKKLIINLTEKPNIFCNLYPSEEDGFSHLQKKIAELQLQDSALTVETVSSPLLGRGFCCGFLGVLHKEIFCQRLEKEFNCKVICTLPNIIYRATKKNGEKINIRTVNEVEEWKNIEFIEEPIIEVKIWVPEEYLGPITQLCQNYRGVYKSEELDNNYHLLVYELPFAEFIKNFQEKLNSYSCGYAFFEYRSVGFAKSGIEKAEILLNNTLVTDLSFFVHNSLAYKEIKKTCQTLKETIARHTFPIVIQGTVNGKIVARENISSLKKNVTGNLYGGDRTRKMKLWKKQKEGKKRMQILGKIRFDAKTFRKILEKKEE